MRLKITAAALLTGLCAGESAADPGAQAQQSVRVTQINAREFRANSWRARVFTPNGNLQMLCFPDSTDSYAEAQVRLPEGSTLENLRLYGNDSSAENLQVSLLRRCQPSFAGGTPASTNLLSISTSGTPGSTTVAAAIPNSPSVDNEVCVYVVRARFGDSASSCDASLALYRVRLQWSD